MARRRGRLRASSPIIFLEEGSAGHCRDQREDEGSETYFTSWYLVPPGVFDSILMVVLFPLSFVSLVFFLPWPPALNRAPCHGSSRRYAGLREFTKKKKEKIQQAIVFCYCTFVGWGVEVFFVGYIAIP